MTIDSLARTLARAMRDATVERLPRRRRRRTLHSRAVPRDVDPVQDEPIVRRDLSCSFEPGGRKVGVTSSDFDEPTARQPNGRILIECQEALVAPVGIIKLIRQQEKRPSEPPRTWIAGVARRCLDAPTSGRIYS